MTKDKGAESTKNDSAAKNDKNDTNSVIEALTAAFNAAITANAPPKKVDMGEFLRASEEPELDRKTYQHGQPIQIRGCSQATLDTLNALQHGVYLDGLVTVTVSGRAPLERVDIDWPWRTQDQRLRAYMAFSSFSDMLQKVSKDAVEQKAAARAARLADA